MHLSVAHNIVHLVTGAMSLWLGLKGAPGYARTFCIVSSTSFSGRSI